MSTDYPELVDSLDHIWRVARLLRRRIAALEQERDEPKARVRELLNGISHTSTELVCKRAVETGEKQFLGLYVHPELGEVPIYVEAQMPLRETGA